MPVYKRQVGANVDRGGSNRIERPGTYHLQVTKLDMEPQGKDGRMINGFRVTALVLDGTAQANGKCIEKGKSHEMTFFDPDMQAKQSSQEMSQRKQDRFFFVVGAIDENNLDQEVEIDTEAIEGRQFIAKFSEREYTDRQGKQQKMVDLHFADMWHVDDVQVADVPKDASMLKLLPLEQRATAEHKAEVARQQYEEPVKQPAAASAIDLDDI